MTRAMALTVLYRLSGSEPEVATEGATWFSAAELWAIESGLSSGGGMEQALTREQLAVLLYRYVGSPTVEESLVSKDEQLAPWAADAMSWAVKKKLPTYIMSSDRLMPQGTLTRAEVAAILQSFIINGV